MRAARTHAEEIVGRLGGRWSEKRGIARCPAHNDRLPSLSVADSAGKPLVFCHAGCSQAAVVDALKRLGLWPISGDRTPAIRQRKASAATGNGIDHALRIWIQSVDPTGTLVETYLHSRAVQLPPVGRGAIRFHPALRHPAGTWPGMVAAITDATSGAFLGVHRTFLDPKGMAKAPVDPDRMILGRKSGGVVRLVADEDISRRLALAEGIETALSAISAGWPCWAAIDAGNMKSLPVWPATDLSIIADHDLAGVAAAEELSARWEAAGGNACIIAPPNMKEDWNDVAQRLRGANG